MSILITLDFESNGDYCDPKSVTWKVQDYLRKITLQEGELAVSATAAFGSYGKIQKVPQVADSEVSEYNISKTNCRNEIHLRTIFWRVLQFWRKKDAGFIILVSGGWPVWSHFLHRMIHDDFQNRKGEDMSGVLDPIMLGRFPELLSSSNKTGLS